MDLTRWRELLWQGLGTPRKHSAENPTCAYCAPTEQTKTLIAQKDLRAEQRTNRGNFDNWNPAHCLGD